MMRKPSTRSRSLVTKRDSSKDSTPHLEDYIVQLEKRDMSLSSSTTNSSNPSDSPAGDTDIYTQLAQKEQDLILAAELGKALLERNEELTRANEKITEDYSAKLEVRTTNNKGSDRMCKTCVSVSPSLFVCLSLSHSKSVSLVSYPFTLLPSYQLEYII